METGLGSSGSIAGSSSILEHNRSSDMCVMLDGCYNADFLKPILQDRDERHILGRHGVGVQVALPHPGVFLPLGRFGLTHPIAPL